jgi:acid stress chaperone HdeB
MVLRGRVAHRMRTKMKPAFVALLSALIMLPAAAARAEKIDLSTMTCKAFVESSKEEIGIILTWLDAYYKDEDDPPVIDTEKFENNAKKLGAYCGANPTIGLITATDKLFGE